MASYRDEPGVRRSKAGDLSRLSVARSRPKTLAPLREWEGLAQPGGARGGKAPTFDVEAVGPLGLLLELPLPGAATMADQGQSMEDRINLHQLMELKAAFDRADTDGGGSLDIQEFLEAFGGVLGKNLSHEQLTHLFMKIDADSNGTIDWDEFTNFMLLENQAASDMSDRSYSERLQETGGPVEPNPKHLHHRDMMDGILQVPKLDRLFTHSRDGTVRVWNGQTLAHQKTLKVSDAWVTGTCHFASSGRVAVSTMDRSISYYDTDKLELVGQLTGLDTSPLCLGCWNDQLQERMIVGDDQGGITLYDTVPRSSGEVSMSAASYRRGGEQGRHSDWVTKVEYYPDLNFCISSSLDGTVKIGELEGLLTKKANRVTDGISAKKPNTTRVLGEGAHGAPKRGVYTFDWSSTAKQLASAGLERTIQLWNPYTRNPKPLAVLQGHTSSVLHVSVNDEGFQLFSCSVDKVIKVWDLRTHKCMQTIYDKTPYRPEDRITAMSFDRKNSRLLTGTTKLRGWPLVKAAKRSTKPKHEHPLCAALYNHNFHQVISGDESAQVCVWDVERGEMVFHFTELHDTKMTAMAFDEAGRRLITGANDGSVRVWNFSNGQCLQQLKNDGQSEVSCITFIVESSNKFVVAGGWNRKVLVWRDETSSSTAPVEPDRVMSGHDEDILSIAYSPPNLLATSGYDGRLLIWNMDSAILKFNLSIGGIESLDVDQRAMWKLTFLEKRTQALVSASADGMLRFWNVKEGCLVWEHDAEHKNKDVVAMCSELTNSFLFTGDGAGFLKVWDICRFLNVAKLNQQGNIIELAHWKAHDGCVASLDYIEKHSLILSASTDSRIKLWKFDADGVHLAGVLGEWANIDWGLADPTKWELVEQELSGRGGTAGAPAPTPAAEAEEEEEDEPIARSPLRPKPSAADVQGSNTQDLIHQILTGRGQRRAPTVPTFRSLKTHSLTEVSPRGGSPRSGR